MYLFSDDVRQYLYEGQIDVIITHDSNQYSVRFSLCIPRQIVPSFVLRGEGTLHIQLEQSQAAAVVQLDNSVVVHRTVGQNCFVDICCNPTFELNYDW